MKIEEWKVPVLFLKQGGLKILFKNVYFTVNIDANVDSEIVWGIKAFLTTELRP